MQLHLFEYAVVRIVPVVEREEFINTGVILYCKKEKYLKTKFTVNPKRITAFCDKLDIEEIQQHLLSFERIAAGLPDGGPIARLDIASRFRWLTAVRSTVIQSSKVHAGFSRNLDETLERLHGELVI
ncbi:MAG: DUF3037 domain-containing protein [Chitinophagaceae bacterium]|nr:DUF3037 domain-containing protein [Chitinophagaceae bacterium]MCW5929470.1 DUF3037 domain-containing protein [Chitinophagaceae bacterium]